MRYFSVHVGIAPGAIGLVLTVATLLALALVVPISVLADAIGLELAAIAHGMSTGVARVLGPLAALPLILATGAAGWLLLGVITAAAATSLCVVALRLRAGGPTGWEPAAAVPAGEAV